MTLTFDIQYVHVIYANESLQIVLKTYLGKNHPKIKKKERKIYQTPLQKSNTKQKHSAATPAVDK